MSKADEMFKKLGYEKDEYSDAIIYCRDTVPITFWIFKKTIEKCIPINIEELQAINEKCKELGWLE